MNDTIRRFGHPETLVAETNHWVILLRPDQPTLGSLVLAAKSDAEALSDLPDAAFADLAVATRGIEAMLGAAVGYAKINYLMLMMVDRHVHYHVIPRYEGERTAAGIAVPDRGWPKAPALGEAVSLDAAGIAALVGLLKPHWPAAG
ncbi:diadenosine tetraphosphate (Ap4A) HIT family hydrolase [Sphingomonas zeicaulis]|uniref:HIT family protein n=1 Tax=Sphingomonas zeicaulis TaxID=1632740 RepID=UPI003D1ED9FB